MSSVLYLVLFAFGGGAVALWIDARFPRLAPRELRGTVLHVGASILLVRLAMPAGVGLAANVGSSTGRLLALFAVTFAALVYTLLAAAWMIKLLQGVLGGLR